MPLPQSPCAVPGFAHVVTPPGTTFQPLAFSSAAEFFGLYGYGLVASACVERSFFGSIGTGP